MGPYRRPAGAGTQPDHDHQKVCSVVGGQYGGHCSIVVAAWEGGRRKGSAAGQARSYLNLWGEEIPRAEWAVIGEAEWVALVDPRSQIAGRPAFAVDVTPDRSWASIAAAGRRADGIHHVELVDHAPGVSWVAARVVELRERHSPLAVIVDPASAAGAIIPALEAARIEVIKPTARDVAAAAGAFYDLTRPDVAGLRHLGQTVLDAAVAGAAQRPLADAWTWNRRGSTVVISPLVAVSLAAWGHSRAPGLQLFTFAG